MMPIIFTDIPCESAHGDFVRVSFGVHIAPSKNPNDPPQPGYCHSSALSGPKKNSTI